MLQLSAQVKLVSVFLIHSLACHGLSAMDKSQFLCSFEGTYLSLKRDIKLLDSVAKHFGINSVLYQPDL